MVLIAINGGLGATIYCVLVWATGGDGMPNQRESLHRIALIRAQKPGHKTLPCKGQAAGQGGSPFYCYLDLHFWCLRNSPGKKITRSQTHTHRQRTTPLTEIPEVKGIISSIWDSIRACSVSFGLGLTHTHTLAHTRTHARTHTRTYTHTHTHTHTRTHTRTSIRTHTHTHTRTRTHTHPHTHTHAHAHTDLWRA